MIIKYFVGKSLSLAGDIGVNFLVDLHDVPKDNAKVVLSWAEGSYAKTEEVQISSLTANSSGQYKLTVRVAAAQMTDNIHAVLYDGETVKEELNYSVATYCNDILEDMDGVYPNMFGAAMMQKLQPLCKALLIYGAKAQRYFNYRTDDPADAGLEYTLEEVGELGTTTFPEGFADACGIESYGTALGLRSETTYHLYFKVLDQEKLDNLTVKLGNETLNYSPNGSLIFYDIANIPAAKVLDDYTLTFGNQTVTVNTGTYISKVLAGTDEALKQAVTALYWYSMAAQDFFSAGN
jgi:hypothetical protein